MTVLEVSVLAPVYIRVAAFVPSVIVIRSFGTINPSPELAITKAAASTAAAFVKVPFQAAALVAEVFVKSPPPRVRIILDRLTSNSPIIAFESPKSRTCIVKLAVLTLEVSKISEVPVMVTAPVVEFTEGAQLTGLEVVTK